MGYWWSVTTNGPEPDPETTRHPHTARQAAVDATATAYTEDGSIDVRARLEVEMRERGLGIDDLWLTEVARGIRSGHHVVVDEDPGSAGG